MILIGSLFNDIAIAAEFAVRECELERAFDAHRWDPLGRGLLDADSLPG